MIPLSAARDGGWPSLTAALVVLLLLCSHALGQFQSAYEKCPTPCDPLFSDQSAWTYYYKFDELDSCDGTILFQMNIYNPVNDPSSHIYYRACTASRSARPSGNRRRQLLAVSGSSEAPGLVELVEIGTGTSQGNWQAAQAAVSALKVYLEGSRSATSIVFARSANVIGGLHAGSQVDRQSASAALSQYGSRINAGSLSQQLVAQACKSSTLNETISPQFFGIILDAQGDISNVQSALRSWNDAECIPGDPSETWDGVSVDLVPGTEVSIVPESQERNDAENPSSSLSTRQSGTCRYIQVQAGDGCYALSERCGVTISQLEAYNGGGNFCSTLKVDQYVCCSTGTLPDFTPQPGGDGSCFAYTVKEGDFCASIAESHQMTVPDIESRNGDTW